MVEIEVLQNKNYDIQKERKTMKYLPNHSRKNI